MSVDYPCHRCPEFRYRDDSTAGSNLCLAIKDELAIRNDLPNDPHNPYVGNEQIRCVAERPTPGANGESIFFNQALNRASAFTNLARVVDAVRIAESHNGKL